MSDFVIINLDGGLGNQLFMLFTGISYAIDNDKRFLIHLEKNKRDFYFDNFLNSIKFNIANNNTVDICLKNIYIENLFNYIPLPKNIDYIKGYFQSYKYFHHNKDKILEIIDIQSFINNYKLPFPSVAIHLRFGDMSFNQSNHAILRPTYFINALKKLLSLKPDLINTHKFIIYGEKEDDEIIDVYIKIINKNLDNQIKFLKFYDIYPNMRDYQELIYMSSSQHLIIPNSTFSWWSAYLCNHPDKIIIRPSRWFGINNINNNIGDLFPPDWIEINDDIDLKNDFLYNL